MVRVLHLNAESVQGVDGVTPEVTASVECGQVKVAAMVQDLGALAVFEIEELKFRTHVHSEAHGFSPSHYLSEHVAGVARIGIAVGLADLAEHTRSAACAGTPGEKAEGARVRPRDHVGLLDTGEALYRRAVKAHAFFKSAL
jgi:hypothetical protein